MSRHMEFRALNAAPANTLVQRLMATGLSVDRIPKPGYILIKASGEAEEGYAAEAVADLDSVVVTEDVEA